MSKAVGVAVGGIIFVAIAIGVYFLWWRKRTPTGAIATVQLSPSSSLLSRTLALPAAAYPPTVIGKPLGQPGLGSQVGGAVGGLASAACGAGSAAMGLGGVGALGCGIVGGVAGAVAGTAVNVASKGVGAAVGAVSSVASKLKFW